MKLRAIPAEIGGLRVQGQNLPGDTLVSILGTSCTLLVFLRHLG